MTLHETKTHDTSTAATVQQHYTQAAEHVAKANDHAVEAAKKTTSMAE